MALNNEKRAAWYTEYAISTGVGAIYGATNTIVGRAPLPAHPNRDTAPR